MRYAIIADVHANLSAFEAVLEDIEKQGEVAQIWCLGDIVGYGPDPHQCIELLDQTDHICVAGNHDLAAIGKIETAKFNPDAAAAAEWTAQQLSLKDINYLGSLPLTVEEGDFTLVHGSPREPVWEYLTSSSVARENFPYYKSQFCLAGHSHVPVIFSHSEEEGYSSTRFQPGVRLALGKSRLIINPGAVGQPRDGDPQASYAIYDSEVKQVRLHRVAYDIRATQDRMVAGGLPLRLVARLGQGI